MKDADVLQAIIDQPGALYAKSRAARWFGLNSTLAELVGPSAGGLYASLYRLEAEGKITSQWGIATPERSGNRPRHYFARPIAFEN